MTFEEYVDYRERVRDLDPEAFGKSGSKTPPLDATDFALRIAYVILNSGMRWRVAKDIWERMRPSLLQTGEVADTFGHPGKVKSIDQVMRDREAYFEGFGHAWAEGRDSVVAYCETLPHIGGITKFHLAKNLGLDVAKPDVWLERVAADCGEDFSPCVNVSRPRVAIGSPPLITSSGRPANRDGGAQAHSRPNRLRLRASS